MEDYIFKLVAISSALLLLYPVIRVVHVIWWRPKRLEKQLRQQGIRGTSYKLLHGDIREIKKCTGEAWSKPMTLDHQISPRALPFFHQMLQKYGKLCVFWNGTRPRLMVGDPELMRLILADKNGHLVKMPLNPLAAMLQLGLSNLEGEPWAKHRKLITPAFHLEKLKRMVPAFETSCFGLIDRWEKLISPQGSVEIDVAPELQNLASDAIARTAFGSSFEEGKRIFELLNELTKLVHESFQKIYIPGFRFIPTKQNKRRYNMVKEINAILRDMIRRKEEAMRINGDSGNDDLLGLLLQCKEESDNNGLTIEDVIEECKLFYFAGQETTATLLTWTLIVLSMHPDWQQKARDEVQHICAKRSLDFEAINQLKIVPTILYEVLRLYPPLTSLYRHTRQKINIGGLSILAGVDLVLPVLLLHNDPNYWGEDVEKFNPERFSQGISKATKDQIAFYPFGWGPRICLGQNFAMVEAKMALAMILQHFSFQLSPSYAHAPCTVITLKPQYGAPIILHRI
ncbi:cytochrome P450 CYP72A616-like [Corylus avellana]|uniref:cytochrome P450 CYP72A616-like n=1 Tax=Corylus avellana TaxID=13451 RepID=UPI00286C28F4|nr:cytochrome P450 CYP72A616-like [Corylus avellana]